MLPSNLFSPACALSLSCARLFVTPWTIACQPPQSMGFSRQENWMGCHFLLQGIFLPPVLACRFFPTEPPGKPLLSCSIPSLSLHSSRLGLLRAQPSLVLLSIGPFSLLFLLSLQTSSFFSPPSLPSCPYSRVALLRKAFIDHPIKNCTYHLPPQIHIPFFSLYLASALFVSAFISFICLLSVLHIRM